MAEAQTFELLKKKRKSFRTAVTKVVNELEAELSNSDLNIDRLSELVETLSIKFEPLTLVDQQLEPPFLSPNNSMAHLGGSALNTVEGFPISAKTYDEAVKLLKNRFANPEILIQAHMNKILSLQPLKNTNDLRSFRKFVDNCNVQLRSLNSLGVSSANYGKFLCPMLLKLIPSDLLLDYNKLQQNGSGSDIQQLLSFLTQSLTAREQTYSTINHLLNYTIVEPGNEIKFFSRTQIT
ncbi:transposon Ty3-G Gag-Pol polyprotein [Trichonephila clavata]|uniref:Transposon Ty3-G Gag-Pol polyprotein n=1 Tax=Trichonephila clavata TaxID=2740835 RepID=A0A8X6FCZ2_TRICU|nr:transposon Ty3-G Gag-Pol polyprotein [Trichonephila clavata]